MSTIFESFNLKPQLAYLFKTKYRFEQRQRAIIFVRRKANKLLTILIIPKNAYAYIITLQSSIFLSSGPSSDKFIPKCNNAIYKIVLHAVNIDAKKRYILL